MSPLFVFVEVLVPCWGTRVGTGYDAEQRVKEHPRSMPHYRLRAWGACPGVREARGDIPACRTLEASKLP